jgi:hypothetical protein
VILNGGKGDTVGPMRSRARAVGVGIAAVRLAAGVALGGKPETFLRFEPQVLGTSMPLLLRTVGIRDLAIGAGTLAAAVSMSDGDLGRWLAAGLASDVLDVAAGVAGARTTGLRSISSALIAAPMVAAGMYALAELRHPQG